MSFEGIVTCRLGIWGYGTKEGTEDFVRQRRKRRRERRQMTNE